MALWKTPLFYAASAYLGAKKAHNYKLVYASGSKMAQKCPSRTVIEQQDSDFSNRNTEDWTASRPHRME
jgi:hypothetical protein